MSENEFPNPYRRQSPKIGLAAMASIAVAIAGGNEMLGAYSLHALVGGIIVGTITSILWLAWKIAGRGVEGHLHAFREGNAVAQWTLPPEQWNEFAKEMRSGNRIVAAIIAIVLTLCALMTGGLIASDGDKFGYSVVTWSVPVGAVIWLILHVLLGSSWQPQRHAVPVVIGPGAGVFGGKIICWNTSGYRLIGAKVVHETCRIQIQSEVRGRHGPTTVTQRVPFPRNAHEEATQVVAVINRAVSPQ